MTVDFTSDELISALFKKPFDVKDQYVRIFVTIAKPVICITNVPKKLYKCNGKELL